MAVAARAGYRSHPRRRSVAREAPEGDGRVRRVITLMVCVTLFAAAVWSRLAYWQIFDHGTLSAEAAAQYTRIVTLPATRGLILDSSGRPMAVNTTVYSVFVSPAQISTSQRGYIGAELSSVLGIPLGQVMATLDSSSQFAYVAKGVGADKAAQLQLLKLRGVGLESDGQRSYLPGAVGNSTLAANLLGFVNSSGVGQYGVEQYYNRILSGRNGYTATYQDLFGNQIVVGDQPQQNPVDGANVQLSIDSNIQYAAEQAIANGVIGSHAESGTVLVMDPHTGRIVAWADYPSYNGNEYQQAQVGQFVDDAASYLYEPGSIMKVVTLGGALDVHAITPQTTLFDPGGVWVDGYYLQDWDQAYKGTITMTRVLEDSLNVGAIKAEQLEGPRHFYHYLQAFGFGRPSGVDVAGEASVPLAPLSSWPKAQLATSAFGQGIDVNMVQMLAAVNVIANGGRYAPPHVAVRIGGRLNPVERERQRQVITPQAAAAMTWMMEQVVQNGSGWTARVPGFALDEAGKTGTAQMPINGHYTMNMWSSYVGFLPASHPRFTMLVVVRAPHNGSEDHNEGYYICGPIFKKIATTIVSEWGITP